jgi:threonine aldolase
VETDECGAPEFFSNGSKLLVAASADGKLTPASIRELATKRHDIHYPKPRAVTITQSTETGRVYTLKPNWARSPRSAGARALAAHGRRALCQRLRQPGLLAGGDDVEERRGCAVLRRRQERHGHGRSGAVFRSRAGHGFRLPLQAGGQLASKMRFLSAPWVGMLESGAWLRNAEHANRCAQQFAAADCVHSRRQDGAAG